MGNIRPSFIKSRALRLVEMYPDQFTDDFDTNKHLVSEFSDVENKRMRNFLHRSINFISTKKSSI